MKKFSLFLLSTLVFFWLASPIHAEANPLDPCPTGESRYRPGGVCERLTPEVYVHLDQYPLTCQDIPIATLNGSGIFPPALSYQRNLTSDISQAELGGLGPNQTAINGHSSDALAQIYMFNGLFDKPISMKNEPREAARTYWRLMSAYDQANAKASYFITVKKSGYVNNTTIEFYNPDKPLPGVTPGQTPGSSIVPSNPKLGFNIGYGSIDPKYCDDAAGRPVTFLVDLHSTNLSDFANCYSRASLRIVRITGLKADTPPADFAAAGANFNSVFGNDYVELGNELNSIDTEYPCSTDLAGCGSAYAAQFAAFRSTFTGPHISAAALNVGNGIYDPVIFLQGAKPAYTASTFLANNAYSNSAGCVFEPIRCSKDSYKWFSQFLGSSAPVILTEYGLAPPNDDKNLNNVLAFYKDLPTDVLAITPLIRNVCPKASGDWLHFNHSNNLLDAKDNLVDPTTCSSASSPDNPTNDKILVLDLKKLLPVCLTTYPVCKDFADVYLKLPVKDRNAYDSLLPFNFDNVRGYEVLNNIVYKENLPYVKAIEEALNSPRTGLLSMLSPQWINDLRRKNILTQSDETGVKDPNTPDPQDYLYHINSDQESGYQNDGHSWADLIVARSRALNPNDCLIHANATYLPAPLTFPVNLDKNNLNIKLNQNVNIPITSVSNDPSFDPLTGLTINHYSWSGSVEGAPVAVLNSPKLQDLSTSIKGPQSLTAIFLPAAGYNPNRDMVAPIGVLTTSNPDTKVQGKTYSQGQARIGRTAGESQTTICELRNKWLLPQGLQKNNVNCVDPYQTLITSVQGPGISTTNIPKEANCDKNAPAGNPSNLVPVDTLLNIGFPSGADKNNVKNCYNDLVNQSNAAGYDPAFVMAIWLEESAASWYSSYPDVADFGCAVNTPRMDFKSQLACFLNLKSAYSNRPLCKAGSSLSYEDFLLVFSEGFAACRNTDGSIPEPDGKCFDKGDNPVSHYRRFCSNVQFPDRIKNYYQLVTGGKSLDFSSTL